MTNGREFVVLSADSNLADLAPRILRGEQTDKSPTDSQPMMTYSSHSPYRPRRHSQVGIKVISWRLDDLGPYQKPGAGDPGSFLFFPLDGIHGSEHTTPRIHWGVTK